MFTLITTLVNDNFNNGVVIRPTVSKHKFLMILFIFAAGNFINKQYISLTSNQNLSARVVM
jgi:hypothetical protein